MLEHKGASEITQATFLLFYRCENGDAWRLVTYKVPREFVADGSSRYNPELDNWEIDIRATVI